MTDHLEQIKTHIVAKGEATAEVSDPNVLDAYTYAQSYSNNTFTQFEVLPHDIVLACYGIYRQINAGSSNVWTGNQLDMNGTSFKSDNDIPYSARKILDHYKPKGFL
jgi:hypothetical protein